MSRNLFWIITIILFIATIIDIIDGDIPKLIGTLSLTLAFLLFAINKNSNQPIKILAIVFIVIAALSYLFRLMRWYEIF